MTRKRSNRASAASGATPSTGGWGGLSATNRIAIVVPLLVAALGGGAALVAKRTHDPVASADVTIDGFTIEDRRSGAQVVDLQIRNAGEQVAYVRRVRFEIHDARTVRFCPLPHMVRASYTYSVRFPSPEDGSFPRTVERRVDQRVAPNDVDRFRVVLGTDGAYIGATYYEVEISLIVNDDDETRRHRAIVRLLHPWRADAFTVLGWSSPAFRACVKRGNRDTREMLARPGERSEGVRRAERVALREQRLIERLDAEATR